MRRENTFHLLSDSYMCVKSLYFAYNPRGTVKLASYWEELKKSHKGHLGPLLLTWFNFNPSMDKYAL